MNTNLKKRERGENWLEEDKIILKDLVKKRVRAIENKNTDTNSNALKVAAWSDLKESFNCKCKGAKRTVTQLKAQWGLLKMKVKRRRAEQRKGLRCDIVWDEFEDMLVPSTSTCEILNDMNEFGKENKTNNVQAIIVDTVEAPPPPISSNSPLLDPSPPPTLSNSNSQMLDSKLKKTKRKSFKSTSQLNKDASSPAERVAACELECRRELHTIQMENEKIRNENLKLEAVLIKHKIEYIKKN